MKKPKSSLYEVQEFHRGKWIPLAGKSKEGKEKIKTVRITEEIAETMNADPKADVKRTGKTSHFRYFLLNEEKTKAADKAAEKAAEKVAKEAAEKVAYELAQAAAVKLAVVKTEKEANKAADKAAQVKKENEIPSFADQKKILRKAGVKIENTDKKSDVLLKFNELRKGK